MSETLGFLAGCLAFTMIWLAARSRKWQYLVPGVLVLLVAISARAGAFFIFPMLALWMGWIFRGEKRFSIQMAAFALIGMAIGYFLLNSLYARTVGIPPGSSFGNFSYALYGQVRGGTGWHSAIEDLGTRNPSIVYREAWQFFLKHPLSLAIGFAKAYRDFFGFGGSSMFPFGAFSSSIWIKISLWLVSMSLLVVGLVRALKDVHNHFSTLILAGFAGMFLSIPFLPPIDGGSRFYAGSAPFFFILPAVGLSWLWGNRQQPQLSVDTWHGDILPAGYFSIAVLVVTLIVPPLLYSLSPRPTFGLPSCPAGQEPFFIEYHPGSYVDLVKSEAQSCGFVPAVCQADFERNNIEKSIDDFYQMVFTLMEYDSSDVRLIPALNFANNKFHYFYLSSQELNGMPSGAISGCAVEVPTRNQTIYQVKSWSLQK